jgi:hypothetical protein
MKSFVVSELLLTFAFEHRRYASVEVPVRHCGKIKTALADYSVHHET